MANQNPRTARLEHFAHHTTHYAPSRAFQQVLDRCDTPGPITPTKTIVSLRPWKQQMWREISLEACRKKMFAASTYDDDGLLDASRSKDVERMLDWLCNDSDSDADKMMLSLHPELVQRTHSGHKDIYELVFSSNAPTARANEQTRLVSPNPPTPSCLTSTPPSTSASTRPDDLPALRTFNLVAQTPAGTPFVITAFRPNVFLTADTDAGFHPMTACGSAVDSVLNADSNPDSNSIGRDGDYVALHEFSVHEARSVENGAPANATTTAAATWKDWLLWRAFGRERDPAGLDKVIGSENEDVRRALRKAGAAARRAA